MSDFLKTFWQYLIPQHSLSSFVHWLTMLEISWLTPILVRQFVRIYDIDLSEAQRSNPEDYQSFNDFFTRSLKVDARPIDCAEHSLISPADGKISQTSDILRNQLIQAKGFQYSLEALVGGDVALANQFYDGQFAVIYLSPRDYHRIHAPTDAKLLSMMYVPGDLFAVNPATVRTVPELFARNERLVLSFETETGPMVLVMVGAIFVGSMETVWAGKITPPYSNTLQYWDYRNSGISFHKGDEIGRFNMGSTVVMLHAKDSVKGLTAHVENTPVRMGQAIATLVNPSDNQASHEATDDELALFETEPSTR
jgi:phosphatidylserine decarboxylase